MSKKNEVEKVVKVDDRIIMSQDHAGIGCTVSRGDIGKVVCINIPCGMFYTLEFPGKGSICVPRKSFDLAPDQPATTKQQKKEPVKKGIRITVKEVKPDVFEVVDFTALDYGLLPFEYIKGYPRVSVAESRICIVKAKVEWLSRGDFLTRKKFDEIVKTCKEAGERLHKINTFPREAFEIVI